MSSTVAANIKQTVQATIDALNAWDYDALVAVRADEFKFQGLPRSLDMPEMDNQAFRDHWFNFMTPSLKDFKVIMHHTKTSTLDRSHRTHNVHLDRTRHTNARCDDLAQYCL